MGQAFVSRHLLELYYSNVFELNAMRGKITEKNNCEDIGMNWMAQYYYPELPLIKVQGTIGSEPTPTQRSSAQ